MAVYKIFPVKDATIYSLYPSRNTGLDEIIESSITTENSSAEPQTSRFLVQFNSTEINDIINNKISGSQWQANFKAYIAVLEGLNLDTKLEFYPISGSWNMGTGKYNYSPEVQNGVSWGWRSYSGSNAWVTNNYPVNVTASYSGTLGGGNWYYSSSNISVSPIYSTQSFNYTESSDIDVNITNMIKAWYSGTIENNGLIAKQAVEFIDNDNYQNKIQYFSRDTHTIYPPQLEFKWRDYIWNTGSSSITIVNTTNTTVALNENPGIFYPESINRFRINSRPTYPVRSFQTSSFYTQNYYLPTSSYFSIRDLDTNEVIIDYDNQYTQLSADEQGSYFTLYMNGLEPERYYKILIKTIINGSTLIFDDNYYFKIING